MKNLSWWNNFRSTPFSRITGFTGTIILLVYFVLLIYLQYERWIYTDSAYTLFRILNLEPLFYDRYGNFLQTFPAQLCAFAGLPAKLIMTVANLSLFVLVLFAVFLLKKLNSAKIFLSLTLISQGALVFFIGYNELLLGLVFFAIACILSETESRYSSVITGAVALLMLFTHPATLALIPIILSLQIHNNRRASLVYTLAAAGIFVIRLIAFPSNSYDHALLDNLLGDEVLNHFSHSYYLHYLSGKPFFWIPFVISSYVLIRLLFLKKFRSGILSVSAFLMVFISGILFFHAGDADQVMEKYLHLLTAAGISSILFLAGTEKHGSFLVVCFLYLVVFITGIFTITPAWKQHRQNVRNAEKHYRETGKYKVLIPSNSFKDYGFSHWALPYETMLISALNDSDTSVNVKVVEAENWDRAADLFADTTFANAPFLPPLSVKLLNPEYFRIPESNYYQDSNSLPWLKH